MSDEANMVAFADDITAVGTFDALRKWWDNIVDLGPKFGYQPQPKKSWLIVKKSKIEEAKQHFRGTNIQITAAGERHLGAVIGSKEFRAKYCEEKIQTWIDEIIILSEIALTEPQAAYACFVSGYQHKFTYFIRTIPEMEEYLQPLEEVIRHRFLAAITGGHLVNDMERDLIALPPRLGGLGIKIIKDVARQEYENSRKMTTHLKNLILKIKDDNHDDSKTKSEIKNQRNELYKANLEKIRSKMNDQEKRTNESNQESGSYNWLTALPIKEHNYHLNKEQFWDALRIRFNWEIPRLPSECACGSKFNLAHALSCKKGGFVSIRHNEVRDITTQLLNEVCRDVRKEPPLITLTGEVMSERTASLSNEARLDISARGFWVPGQRVFCDVRVFDLSAQRYRNSKLRRCFQMNEDEKKKKYNDRVLQVENASFTPLVFSANGGMGRECKKFYSRLAEMIAEKRGIAVSDAATFVRTRISFSLLRSTLLCVRGSRSTKIQQEISELDIQFANFASKIN